MCQPTQSGGDQLTKQLVAKILNACELNNSLTQIFFSILSTDITVDNSIELKKTPTTYIKDICIYHFGCKIFV